MSQFKSERFNVSLQNNENHEDWDQVIVHVSIDGVKIYDAESNNLRKSCELSNITRWEIRHGILDISIKTFGDLEEKRLSFTGETSIVNSLLDTIASASMQLYELLKTGQVTNSQETVNQLSTLVHGSTNKKYGPSTEDVQFWRNPDKEGWMYSQGEVIKTWRKRWFVLKSGFLLRFATSDIDHTSRIRGAIDLSHVTDVTDGKKVTGRSNSIKLSTENSFVCYITESETSMVEWISAIEQSINKIVKKAAGLEDEAETLSNNKKKLLNSFKSLDERRKKQSGGSRNSTKESISRSFNDQLMVDISGYDDFDATAPPANLDIPKCKNSISGTSNPYNNNNNNNNNRYFDSNEIVQVKFDEYEQQASGAAESQLQQQQKPVTVNNMPIRNYPRIVSTTNDLTCNSGMYPTVEIPVDYTEFEANTNSVQITSIMDLQPSQQPAYPTYQNYDIMNYSSNMNGNGTGLMTTTVPEQPASWQVLYTNDGRPYYHNRLTGHTQWETPAEMATTII